MRLLAVILVLLATTAALVAAGAAAQAPATQQTTGGPPSSAQEISPAVAAFMKPIEAAPGDDALRQKLIERHNSAVRLLALRVEEHRRGIVDAQTVFDAERVVADAKLDVAQNDDERTATLQQIVQASKDVEARLERQVQAGVGSPANLESARLARLTAEVQLLKLKHPATAPDTAPERAPATTQR